MSTQPGDPSPHDPAPARRGETETPPPGFLNSAAALFANRTSKLLALIVVVLLIALGIAMVISTNSSSKEPGPGGAVDRPSPLALVVAR